MRQLVCRMWPKTATVELGRPRNDQVVGYHYAVARETTTDRQNIAQSNYKMIQGIQGATQEIIEERATKWPIRQLVRKIRPGMTTDKFKGICRGA